MGFANDVGRVQFERLKALEDEVFGGQNGELRVDIEPDRSSKITVP
jgi:hypothetical protein